MKNTKNKNVKGQKFNRLTIITDPYRKNRRTYVYAQCECTNIIETQLYKIQSGHTQGCGCIKIKKRTHNLSKHPLYSVWQGIRRRCYEKNAINYHNYGGRGIGVCNEWRYNFENFYNWAIDNNWNKKLQVDRINNDLGYSPSNCQIVTNYENSQNKRTTKFVIFDTIIFTLSEAMRMNLIDKSKYYKNNAYRNSFKIFGDIAS
jgi:hypothetical protein